MIAPREPWLLDLKAGDLVLYQAGVRGVLAKTIVERVTATQIVIGTYTHTRFNRFTGQSIVGRHAQVGSRPRQLVEATPENLARLAAGIAVDRWAATCRELADLLIRAANRPVDPTIMADLVPLVDRLQAHNLTPRT